MTQQLSARQPRYKRIPLKLSGEALIGSKELGIDPKVLGHMVLGVGRLAGIGVQVGPVIGGGNLSHGAALSAAGMDWVTGDHMGMLITMMNSLTMRDTLECSNIPALVTPAVPMVDVTDHYDRHKATRHLGSGEVVIFSAGTGNPFFTTDSATCLCAIEIDADVVLKATKVDSVHTVDPFKGPNAEKFERLTYDGVPDRKLGAVDLIVICLCRDQSMLLWVFNVNKPGALLNIIVGGTEGTPIEGG